MLMESPVIRARELRRHDLLEDAARERLARRVRASRDMARATPTRASWIHAVFTWLANFSQRLRVTPRTPTAGHGAFIRR
jgi:hypothetical protein